MAICYINFHSWLFHGALVALRSHHQTTTPICHLTNITTQKMIILLGLDPQSCIDMEFIWVVTPRPQESKCMPFPISQIFLTKPSLNPHQKKNTFFS
jgi:hypothetical protein